MKKILLLISVLLAAIVPATQAQNAFIKEIGSISTDYTIVRTVDDTSWLTYNLIGSRSMFILSTKSNPIAEVMDLGYDKIEIRDFEIGGGTVYFCGTTLGQTPGVAVAGFFYVSTFPSSLVHYATYDDMISFDRMDLLESDGILHILMVGQTEEWTYHFVDAHVVFPYTFIFNEYTGTETIAERLYDIAATKDYVVFTGHSNSIGKPVLFYINHTSTGFVPNPLPAQYLEYNYNSSRPVWIEHCEKNAIATATIGENNLLFVSAYLGTSHHSTQCSFMSNGIQFCADLKYNSQDSVLDVLTRRIEEEAFSSTIYHYRPGCVGIGSATVFGHKMDNYWLHSLTDSHMPGPAATASFVTTGGNQNLLFSIHKYLYSTTYPCWEKVQMSVIDFNGTDKTVDIELVRKKTNVEEKILYKTQYECEISNQCTSHYKEEDEL